MVEVALRKTCCHACVFPSCPRFRARLAYLRFELDFRRRGFFLNDSNFWCVQSSITHNVAVHVHVLWPVCTHTITFRIFWCP